MPTIPYVDGVAWSTLGSTAAPLTPQAAESLAAVLCAVNAIACTVASLPAYVVRTDGAATEAPDHPLQRLIDGGLNDNETWSDFVEGMLSSSLLAGNFLAQVSTNQRGELRSLTTIPWPTVTPWIAEDGSLSFDVVPMLPPDAGKRRRLLREDCLYVRDRADNGVIGRSRISRAATSMQSAIDLERNSWQFLANASRPAGSLTAPGRISRETADRLAQDWDNNYRGERFGKTAVLPEGLKWEPLSLLSAEDSQLIAHRNFSVSDVARIFSVPPHLLADPQRSTFASSREATRHFASTCLIPWTRRIERAFAQSVLSSGYRLRFDLDSLLKADIGELYSALLKGRQAGFLSPNDCRSETGFAASTEPGADSLEPPVAGGRAAGDPPPTDGDKVAPFVPRRHAAE